MIECAPVASAPVENVVWPKPLSVPVPMVVAPSLNVTVPVGVPPEPLTVAVKVTDWPNALGSSEEVIAVVVLLGLTVCVSGDDVLAELLPSPPYTTVIACAPAISAPIAKVATPAPFSVPVPNVVAPSLKVTVPVGVVPAPLTVAVKVTLWLSALGLGVDDSVVVVIPLLTTCETADDVLVVKLVSPP